jgi:hypothetical protein
MKQEDISKIDKNFKINNQMNEDDWKWINPLESNQVSLYGLAWLKENHNYDRLPVSCQKELESIGPVSVVSRNSTGVQCVFYATTSILLIRVKLGYMYHMGHMAYTGQAGFDCYRGNSVEDLSFLTSSNFDFSHNEYVHTFFIRREKERKLYLLNFPLYATVDSIEIGVDKDAVVEACPSYFKEKGKLVFYGTSITQGGCASRPGMAYTNILSRELGIECLNYGFSGNGKGERFMANLIGSLDDVRAYFIDYEANVTFEDLKKTLIPFLDELTSLKPNTPIVFASRIKTTREVQFNDEYTKESLMRPYEEEIVTHYPNANLIFIDGTTLLGENPLEKTVDGVHPTDYGFAGIAENLLPVFKKILHIE